MAPFVALDNARPGCFQNVVDLLLVELPFHSNIIGFVVGMCGYGVMEVGLRKVRVLQWGVVEAWTHLSRILGAKCCICSKVLSPNKKKLLPNEILSSINAKGTE